MLLTDYLRKHPKGTFSIGGSLVGKKASYRLIEVYPHNHQDIWVWHSLKGGKLRPGISTVANRIDRKTGQGNRLTASDYEVVE